MKAKDRQDIEKSPQYLPHHIKSLIVGTVQNFLFLLILALVYNYFFRLLVISHEWARFFGEAWYFIIEMSILPLINLLRKKIHVAIGNIIGVGVYFFMVIIAFAIFGN